MAPRWDVAIAGAGIGGVVLALSLARQGLRVVVAEQVHRFPPVYRGEFLQPRSLEILTELGLRAEIDAVTAPVHQVRMTREDGSLLGVVDYQALDGPVREGRNGLHREIQAAVIGALQREPSARLLMGTRVTGVLWDPSGAAAGLQTTAGPLPARLTVGAEGQRSVVRDELGLPCRVFRYPGVPLAVTVELGEPAPPVVRFIFGRGRSALLFPLPGGRARFYLVIPDDLYAGVRAAPDRGLGALKEALIHFFPQYERGIRHIPSMSAVQPVPCWYLRAGRWVANGAAILGDAAHCVSPTRGQGMNLAIQDAAALAELVGALPRDRRPTAADLAPYERVRRRPADFIQRDAGRVHRLLLAEHPALLLARDLWLGALRRAPETTAAVLRMYAGTARPPVWYDHLFVSAAVFAPPLDRWVARVWGGHLPPAPSPVPDAGTAKGAP